jgi:hypothetical protein
MSDITVYMKDPTLGKGWYKVFEVVPWAGKTDAEIVALVAQKYSDSTFVRVIREYEAIR